MSTTATMIDPERVMLGEVEMVGQERWEEIHRRARAGVSIRAIARELELDRKTVRRCLRQTAWRPYQRAARSDTLLTTHADYLRRRAAEVGYSAQVLFQELQHRQYHGSYETVKRFVRPLRETRLHAAVTRTRFETPPGLQSQIDWGQSQVRLGARLELRHIFVLTLGFSRRSFYVPCLSETLGELLDAHEQAFAHFGGHTQEHLYDRPRTVCAPSETNGVRWNTTFKAFADFWGFEPRLCRPYRAQTKGKVESGVKYFKRNFLVGRRFGDDLDFNEQLQEWMATVADVRVHGTTHERPIDRFARERDALEPAPPVRRYEREHPGELLHLNVKKLARFEQPGHRVTGNRRQCTPGRLGLRTRLHRRPLPRRLPPDLSRRDRRPGHRLPPGRRRLLPPARRAGHRRDDRQRPRIPLAMLRRVLRSSGAAPSLHSALYAPHQRKGRTLHSNRPPRMGLRPRIPNLTPARRSPDALVASIQLAPTTCQSQPPALPLADCCSQGTTC